MRDQNPKCRKGARLRFTIGLAGATAVAIAVNIVALRPAGAKSIFDDDFKSMPDSQVKAQPRQDEPPPTPVTRPRLPPVAPVPPTPPAPENATPPDVAVNPRPLGESLPVRIATPNAQTLALAEKLVKEVFKPEYDNHTQAGRPALARLLIGEARQSAHDPAAQYILLRDARDFAESGGDPEIAVEASRDLRDAFLMTDAEAEASEHSALLAAAAAMVGPAPSKNTPPEIHQSVMLLMGAAERIFRAQEYETAAKFASLAEQLARRTVDTTFLDRVRDRQRYLQAVARDFLALKEPLATLKLKPDDGASNLAVGKFYTFLGNRPGAGIEMLAKSTDPAMKGAAALDLANPATGAGQIAVADAWSAIAKSGPIGPIRDGIQQRAMFWYNAALPQLQGLTRVGIEKRAAELGNETTKRGLLGEYYRGHQFGAKVFSRIDSRLEFVWHGQKPDEDIPVAEFSVRWTGFVKAPSPGVYKFVVVHDDVARIWIDGQQVYEKNDAGRGDFIAKMNGSPQALKIEYAQYSGDSYFGLGWILPRTTKAQSIPAEAFSHSVSEPGRVSNLGVDPEMDGSFNLLAAKASLHNVGNASFGQVDENRIALGNWGTIGSLTWDFNSPGGDYDVDIVNASDGNNTGATFSIAIGNNRLKGTVPDTGGWNNYKPDHLGRIRLIKGPQNLRLVILTKPNGSVMNLESVRLTPVK